jgi:competence protein ComEC
MPEEATFLRSLIIGDRSDLGAEVKNAFINAGVMHVIAVSGLHVAVVVLMLFALIRLTRLPEWAGFMLLSVSLAYIPLTGSSLAGTIGPHGPRPAAAVCEKPTW